MVRQLGHFVLPSVCCHNCSHVNEFNWLSWPTTNFFASALRCQTPRGLLLHLKKEPKSKRREHLPWQLSCHMAFFCSVSFPPQCLIETRTDIAFNSNRQHAHNNMQGFYCLEDLMRKKIECICTNVRWCGININLKLSWINNVWTNNWSAV